MLVCECKFHELIIIDYCWHLERNLQKFIFTDDSTNSKITGTFFGSKIINYMVLIICYTVDSSFVFFVSFYICDC